MAITVNHPRALEALAKQDGPCPIKTISIESDGDRMALVLHLDEGMLVTSEGRGDHAVIEVEEGRKTLGIDRLRGPFVLEGSAERMLGPGVEVIPSEDFGTWLWMPK